MSSCKNMEKYWDTIVSCPLFVDIPLEHIEDMLVSLNGRIEKYEKNEIILHAGDEFQYCRLVLDGTVEVSYNTSRYEKMNVNHFQKGDILGEALALKGAHYSPVQITSLTNSTILSLDLQKLITSPERCSKSCLYNHQLLLNLMGRMAEQNVFSNLKLRILAQKSLRDRILVYLIHVHADGEQGATIPFSQTALSEFLGVNRSALSRELGRMQNEGIVMVEGRRYWLKSKP